MDLVHRTKEIALVDEATLNETGEGIDQITERKLVKRARRGDAGAFEKLIEASSGRLFALLNRMVNDPTAVEDVAQNAYLKAWSNLGGFHGRARFSTWLYRIVVNEALTHIRQETRRKSRELGGREMLLSIPAGGSVEGTLVNRISVRHALTKLPHAYRTAISLSYMDDLTYEEAAAVMEVPLNTYRTYLHRGKIKLRRIIEGVEV